jgi:aryl-alcohol dehydrogenase-like predicted oxidoreductase
VDSGKVRYVGVSNYTGWQLMKALGIAERDHLPKFISQQIYYSLQERSAEYELIPAAHDQGLGTLVWSPLAGGLLSGKYRRGQDAPEGSRHLTDWNEPPVYDENRLYETIDILVEIAEQHDVSAAQVALAWLLTRPTVASVVIGARTDEQLADNLKAADLELTGQQLSKLEEVSRQNLIYPYWHQRKTAADRLSPADLTLLAPHID